eukprot:668868-Prymnesium_polylepis.1
MACARVCGGTRARRRGRKAGFSGTQAGSAQPGAVRASSIMGHMATRLRGGNVRSERRVEWSEASCATFLNQTSERYAKNIRSS